ncbi:2-aminomuconate deaminase [Flavobacteriales bacterium]|nr:putative aminoacrylate peracid reductase RutC [Flavobacteriales bacterium]GIK70323.1 MAG: reactive intermediate/imine deaminase [Bacteroidota bacterium]CAG0990538.1 2-aminomuconate deaminase [Flavobacteriales bacterium]
MRIKNIYFGFFLLLILNIAACNSNNKKNLDSGNMKKIIETPNAPAPIGPYSQAVLASNTLYISGQIAINPLSGELITQTIEAETKQVMENLKAVLNEAGMDFNHVVKCSIFISDMNHFGKINEVYGSYFEKEFPARETVQVAKLPKDVNVEISAIAVK